MTIDRLDYLISAYVLANKCKQQIALQIYKSVLIHCQNI